MEKKITIFSIIVISLGLLAIQDYHNYFKGRSIINYHKLPYELTPEYYKDHVIEDGKSMLIERFDFITDSLESIGHGRSIPMASYYPTFTIDKIKCYYYNDDSIFVLCVDEKNKPHWIIPIYDHNYVVFDEMKNVKIENLAKYKCVSDLYDEK